MQLNSTVLEKRPLEFADWSTSLVYLLQAVKAVFSLWEKWSPDFEWECYWDFGHCCWGKSHKLVSFNWNSHAYRHASVTHREACHSSSHIPSPRIFVCLPLFVHSPALCLQACPHVGWQPALQQHLSLGAQQWSPTELIQRWGEWGWEVLVCDYLFICAGQVSVFRQWLASSWTLGRAFPSALCKGHDTEIGQK